MSPSRRIAVSLLAGALVCLSLLAAPALSDEEAPPPVDPQAARKAMEAAIERGRVLFSEPWVEGGKTCLECHGRGANQLRATRLKAYPKFDFVLGRIVTGQQKLNHMIESQAKGNALALGHEDLTALEAYISTLR